MMKKNRYKILTIFLISFIIVGVKAYQKSPPTWNSVQDIGSHRIPESVILIQKGTSYIQSFRSHFNDLFMIALFVPNQFLPTEACHFSVEDETGKPITHAQLNTQTLIPPHHSFYALPPEAEITNSGFYMYIPFPPIQDSKDKLFSIKLECASQDLKIGARLHQKYYEGLSEGQLFMNHQPISGHLAFRTFHTFDDSLIEILTTIGQRISQDKGFLILYCFLILIVLCSLLLLWLKKA